MSTSDGMADLEQQLRSLAAQASAKGRQPETVQRLERLADLAREQAADSSAGAVADVSALEAMLRRLNDRYRQVMGDVLTVEFGTMTSQSAHNEQAIYDVISELVRDAVTGTLPQGMHIRVGAQSGELLAEVTEQGSPGSGGQRHRFLQEVISYLRQSHPDLRLDLASDSDRHTVRISAPKGGQGT